MNDFKSDYRELKKLLGSIVSRIDNFYELYNTADLQGFIDKAKKEGYNEGRQAVIEEQCEGCTHRRFSYECYGHYYNIGRFIALTPKSRYIVKNLIDALYAAENGDLKLKGAGNE